MKPLGGFQTASRCCCGVGTEDTEADARYIADKIAALRIFEDGDGKLNRSLQNTGGAVLLVSQFTLYADARNGRRPSFSAAARPEQAERLYQTVADLLRGHGLTVETGRFQTHMQITLCNDGPVTLLLDSNKTVLTKLTEQPAQTDRQKAAKEIKKQPFPPSSGRLKDVSATNGILQTTHLKDLMVRGLKPTNQAV